MIASLCAGLGAATFLISWCVACDHAEADGSRSCIARLHPGDGFDEAPTLSLKVWLQENHFSACGIDFDHDPPNVCRVPAPEGEYSIDPRMTPIIVAPWKIYSSPAAGTLAHLRIRFHGVLDDVPGYASTADAILAAEMRVFIGLNGLQLPEALTSDVSSEEPCAWQGEPQWRPWPDDWAKPVPVGGVAAGGSLLLSHCPCWRPDNSGVGPPCDPDRDCREGPFRLTAVVQVRLPDGRWGQDVVSFDIIPDGPPPLHLSGVP